MFLTEHVFYINTSDKKVAVFFFGFFIAIFFLCNINDDDAIWEIVDSINWIEF